MSVSSTLARVQYTVTQIPQSLGVTFPFNQPADLAVYDGANTCILGGDYTVSGGGYNTLNQLQTGAINIVSDTSPGAANIQIGDVITIIRGILPVQLTTFTSTGLLTPLMIEADDDKLTTLIQQLLLSYYNPFPTAGAIIQTSLGAQIISGTTNFINLGWITAQTGGIRTSIDSLNVVGIPTIALPLVISVIIGGFMSIWQLRPMQIGDPSSSIPYSFVVPLVNPNSLIWTLVK
jgi:hypothetical protein